MRVGGYYDVSKGMSIGHVSIGGWSAKGSRKERKRNTRTV